MSSISLPTDPVQTGVSAVSRSWLSWFTVVNDTINAVRQSGTTAQRPVKGLYRGRGYFDTDVALPIVYDGSGWTDYAGNSV